MKKMFLLLISMVSLFANCEHMFYQGFIPQSSSTNTKFLCYSEYSILYNLEQGIVGPLYSAEYLTADQLKKAQSLKRTDSFHNEESLSTSQQVTVDEYKNTGYDRGHLAPNKDFSNEQFQFECFSMANMIPQAPENNRGVWSKLEGFTRHVTFKNKETFVLTGPMYDKGLWFANKTRIPSHIWKAIYVPSLNSGVVFVATNNNNPSVYAKSIQDFERILGYKLFKDSSSFKVLDLSEFRFDDKVKKEKDMFNEVLRMFK